MPDYTYLAAGAESATIREAAERLAGEELRHAAALLRRERRKAWHRERPLVGGDLSIVVLARSSGDGLGGLLAQGTAAELEPVGIVDDTIQDRIGKGPPIRSCQRSTGIWLVIRVAPPSAAGPGNSVRSRPRAAR